MKIYLGNYKNNWISPYTVLEKFFFWKKDYDAHEKVPPKWLTSLCELNVKILDTINRRIEYIKIDSWDTWNADGTLALIILPLLKKLKEEKAGSPHVEDSDVPDQLKSCNAPRVENVWDCDENHHKRWEYVLDEMIWAFEQMQPNFDWQNEYEIKDKFGCFLGWDDEAMKLHHERINKGLILFGRYYQSLWT